MLIRSRRAVMGLSVLGFSGMLLLSRLKSNNCIRKLNRLLRTKRCCRISSMPRTRPKRNFSYAWKI